jgi:heme/copper-type cytochrome/quinol oxidase subunit 1
MLAIMILAYPVWAHHMFVTGMFGPLRIALMRTSP